MLETKFWNREMGTAIPSSVCYYFDKLSELSVPFGVSTQKDFTYNPSIACFKMTFVQTNPSIVETKYFIFVELNGEKHLVFSHTDSLVDQFDTCYVELMDIITEYKKLEPVKKEAQLVQKLLKEIDVLEQENQNLKNMIYSAKMALG